MAINTGVRVSRPDNRAQNFGLQQDLSNISQGIAQGFNAAIDIRKRQVDEFNKQLENLDKLRKEGDIAHRNEINKKINEVYNNVTQGVFQARKKGGKKFVGIGAQTVDVNGEQVPLDEYIRRETQDITTANTRSQQMKDAYNQAVNVLQSDQTINAAQKARVLEQMDERFRSKDLLFNTVDGLLPDNPEQAFGQILDKNRSPELARKLAVAQMLDGMERSKIQVTDIDGQTRQIEYIEGVHELVGADDKLTTDPEQAVGVRVSDDFMDNLLVSQIQNNPLALRDLTEGLDVEQQAILESGGVGAYESFNDLMKDEIKNKFELYVPKPRGFSYDEFRARDMQLKEEANKRQQEQLALRSKQLDLSLSKFNAEQQKEIRNQIGGTKDENVRAFYEDTAIIKNAIDQVDQVVSSNISGVNFNDIPKEFINTWNLKDKNGVMITPDNWEDYRSKLELVRDSLIKEEGGTVTTNIPEDEMGRDMMFFLDYGNKGRVTSIEAKKNLIDKQIERINTLMMDSTPSPAIAYLELDGGVASPDSWNDFSRWSKELWSSVPKGNNWSGKVRSSVVNNIWNPSETGEGTEQTTKKKIDW